MRPLASARADWPAALATVINCHYETGAGHALAFGIPADNHFHITFNFWAASSDGSASLQTADFYSAKALPQNTLFPITYNPGQPTEWRHADA